MSKPSWESKILYHKTKTSTVNFWRVWSEGGSVKTAYGKLNTPNPQTSSKDVEPTNVGKKNERGVNAQAIFEAQALYENKLKRKYTDDISAVDIPLMTPMLAHKYTEKKVQYPADVQAKLDGVRCLAISDGKSIKLVSRSGLPYDVRHIVDDLRIIMGDKPWVLDGEIYIHGESRQRIISLVKKPGRDGRKDLQYHVYDVPSGNTWKNRYTHLENLSVKIFMSKCSVVVVPTYLCTDFAAVNHHHSQFIQDGYEGTIIRNLSGLYEFGYRSSNLLKLKDFLDAEFKVVGFRSGKGRMKDAVVFTCAIPYSGMTFEVSMKATMEKRREYFTNGESYVGRQLTVRYQHLSDDGIPCFGVGIDFRSREDLPLITEVILFGHPALRYKDKI